MRASLYSANLSGADLRDAWLSGATFSTSTTFFDGQTVLEHGFDAIGLEALGPYAPAI